MMASDGKEQSNLFVLCKMLCLHIPIANFSHNDLDFNIDPADAEVIVEPAQRLLAG